MNIGITKKKNAYTPEAYAYKNYLEKYGCQIQFDYEDNLDPNNDINIFFMGIRPFWNREKGNAIEIHEYQSLSTGSYPKLKDYVKKVVNIKPNKRIFLNENVHKGFCFQDSIPFIYRDMGVDSSFFNLKKNIEPEYDIVYCGSISGRVGLVDAIIKLSSQYKIIVIGSIEKEVYSLFENAGIVMTGRIDRKFIPEIYAKCKYGLNYTPDIYPYNIQTSTKTLEYLASGLEVISNRYYWAEDFCLRNNMSFHWYNNMEIIFSSTIDNDLSVIKNYEWNNVLERIKFLDYIKADK